MFPEARVAKDDKNSRFTLEPTNVWAKQIANVTAWDLDVAACDEAHLAPRYFTAADDGLVQRWDGVVWCNPPYEDLEPWVRKAWTSWVSDSPKVIAMLIPADRVEQQFWQMWVEPYRDGRGRWHKAPDVELETHNPPGRQRFGHPGNPAGVNVDSAPFPVVLLVWRRNGERSGEEETNDEERSSRTIEPGGETAPGARGAARARSEPAVEQHAAGLAAVGGPLTRVRNAARLQ